MILASRSNLIGSSMQGAAVSGTDKPLKKLLDVVQLVNIVTRSSDIAWLKVVGAVQHECSMFNSSIRAPWRSASG
jgi:hypothetical protein